MENTVSAKKYIKAKMSLRTKHVQNYQKYIKDSWQIFNFTIQNSICEGDLDPDRQ